MVEADRERLNAVLVELCQAVGADAGATLLVESGDGTLQQAAATEPDRSGQPSALGRLLGAKPGLDGRRTLAVRLDGTPEGVVLLSRRSGSGFTQQPHILCTP